MADSLRVDGESSLSPSPTLGSSPQSNSGYDGSLDSSPSSDRAGRQKSFTPHSPGPGLPRGSTSSSSGDEINFSNTPPKYDENHEDSLLYNEMKPMSEQKEYVEGACTIEVTAMLSLEEVQDQELETDYKAKCTQLEMENGQLKSENRQLKSENRRLQEKLKKFGMQERQPLAQLNGRVNTPISQ